MSGSKLESEKGSSPRRQRQFQIGDRVITSNCRLGTVVRVDRDGVGDYIVVRLDILPSEFTYDPWDLEKI